MEGIFSAGMIRGGMPTVGEISRLESVPFAVKPFNLACLRVTFLLHRSLGRITSVPDPSLIHGSVPLPALIEERTYLQKDQV